MMKKWLLLKNITISRLECKNHTQFMTKMAKIYTLFMTKTVEKPYPLGPHILCSPYKGVPPPPVLSNLVGSLSLSNDPTELILRKPNKNKMAGVNSRFASVWESIFNSFLLKMLSRSLSVYILKQLFFSISVNSDRIFTSISKNNC